MLGLLAAGRLADGREAAVQPGRANVVVAAATAFKKSRRFIFRLISISGKVFVV